MKKIKVKVDTKPLISGDVVRGVGFYTVQLISHLKKLEAIELVEKGFDIIHYPYFNSFFLTLPANNNVKTVVTIHDLIPLIYPKHYPPGIKGNIRFWIQKMLIKRVDAIITVSEASKKDIVRFLGISAEKIFVTYEAAGEIFKLITNHQSLVTMQRRYRLPERFVLYVGDVNYNKNISGLAEACRIAKIPLVIAGKQAASKNFDRNHVENRPLVNFLRKYGRSKDIMRIGFIPDEDLVRIFNLATIYCQPSFYEGFGLPVLQAFACGTPVVASRIGALVEIADDAAVFVDPQNPEDIASAINKVISDDKLRKALVEKGFRRAKEFSWDKTARETVEVYKKLLNNDKE